MKRTWISLVSGIAVGGMVFGCAGVAFADNVTKAINATYKNIQLVIDGETFVPKDPNGNVVEPFIYNGTTYLPIRAVGQVFNKGVNWDGATNTVYIGEMPAKAAKEVFLFDKPYTSCNDPSGFKNFEEKGHNYVGFNNCIRDVKDTSVKLENERHQGTSYVVYPLNGNATKVKGTFVAPQDTYGNPEFTFTFYDQDGKALFESPTMRENVAPIDFEFEASGVLSLKISVTKESKYDWSDTDQYIKDFRILTTEY